MSEKIEASAEQVSRAQCDDCRTLKDIRLLDAVLLDAEGARASSAIYCETCWPKHKVVQGDMWRSAIPGAAL